MTNVVYEIRFFDFVCSIFNAVIRHSAFEIVIRCRQTTGVAFEITVAGFESAEARFEGAAIDFGTAGRDLEITEVPFESTAAASLFIMAAHSYARQGDGIANEPFRSADLIAAIE